MRTLVKFKAQSIPLIFTIITFLGLSILLYFFLHVLNLFPLKGKIAIVLRPADILVGMTIYLKTSIDFALFMGNLMQKNGGWKKRIAIELGTALGNGLGTIFVLFIWFFFKEAPILMIVMIVLAALVLFRMAEEGFQHTMKAQPSIQPILHFPLLYLSKLNLFFRPLLRHILPETGIQATNLSFSHLLFFSITIPFILGLDDFAGYIPLFSIINVFSFIIGVFFAHMLLNIGLFASPKVTTKITRHPIVTILGSIAFVGIGIWGLIEAGQISIHIFKTF